jgi:hypothetical protein
MGKMGKNPKAPIAVHDVPPLSIVVMSAFCFVSAGRPLYLASALPWAAGDGESLRDGSEHVNNARKHSWTRYCVELKRFGYQHAWRDLAISRRDANADWRDCAR